MPLAIVLLAPIAIFVKIGVEEVWLQVDTLHWDHFEVYPNRKAAGRAGLGQANEESQPGRTTARAVSGS